MIKVLYIAGATRSGSTVLSNILGEIETFFNAGEIIDIWDKGLLMDVPCGCGVPLTECTVWDGVLRAGFSSSNGIDVHEMALIRNRLVHSRYMPWLLSLSKNRSRAHIRLDRFLRNTERLYDAITSVTSCRVIVDSSKNPAYACMLSMIPSIDLYILHLIRDSRATAYSWLKKKQGLEPANPTGTSIVWDLRNIVTEMLRKNLAKRFLRLYYEDFVGNPEKTVQEILAFVREMPTRLPFVTQEEVKLGINHTVYGNPDRFQKGVLRIGLDSRWRGMKRRDKIIVTMLTGLLLIKYRYPLMPGRRKSLIDGRR